MAGGGSSQNGGTTALPPGSSDQALVLIGDQGGRTLIYTGTPLTRLNYFDGKFLRAQDMSLEQTYLRRLNAQSNIGGGPGVVDGMTASLVTGTDSIQVDPGLAIDGLGQVLYLPQGATVGIQDLIDRSGMRQSTQMAMITSGSADFAQCVVQSDTQPQATPVSAQAYILLAGWAQALCGNENVYGQLCEDACSGTTERPFLVEGVVLWLRPLPLLQTPNTISHQIHYDPRIHLRSLLASEVFAEEPKATPSLISGPGLREATWCNGALVPGALVHGPAEVPLAVVARLSSTTTLFLDAWTVRRERIEAPARQYWAWRMAMRPWNVFLAQVLQFQCQLHDVLGAVSPVGPPEMDPCAPAYQAIAAAGLELGNLQTNYISTLEKTLADQIGKQVADLRNRLIQVVNVGGPATSSQVLINGGILELPPAGYLPVDNTPNAQTVNDQALRLLGKGLDLRFCVVRPDYVPHALEEAQHMQRIPLLDGLDDPKNKPKVDVLVPEGQILDTPGVSPGRGFEASAKLLPVGGRAMSLMDGAARIDSLGSGGYSLELATVGVIGGNPGAGGGLRHSPINTILNLATLTSAAVAAVTTTPVSDLQMAFTPQFDLNVNRRVGIAAGTTAALRSSFAAGTPSRTVAQPPTLTPQANEIAAAWIFASSELDLLKMTIGQRSTVILRGSGFDSLAPGRPYAQASAIVTLVDAPTGVGGQRTLYFQVDGLGSVTDHGSTPPVRNGSAQLVATVNESEIGGSIQIDVQIALAPTGKVDPPPGPKVDLSIKVQAGPPATIQIEVKAGLGGPDLITMANLTLTENRDVLLAQNPKHILALKALKLIGAEIKDPNFADTEALSLFPPPATPAGTRVIRPGLDWVFFTRRREIDCGDVAPSVATGRRYRIYHSVVSSLAAVTSIQKIFHSPDPSTGIQGLSLLALGDFADFGAGVPTLLTNPATLINDLKTAHAGNRIEYAVLLPRDSTDGSVLARARLSALEAALASGFPVDLPNQTTEVLEPLPAALDTPGTDGAIVLITMPAPTACTTIYRVTQTVWNRVAKELAAGNFTSLPKLDHLGPAIFELDSTNLASDTASLQGAWNSLSQHSDGVEIDVFWTTGDKTIGNTDFWSTRAYNLASLFNFGKVSITTMAIGKLPPDTGCPVLMFFVEKDAVVETCHRVFWLNEAHLREFEAAVAAGSLGDAVDPKKNPDWTKELGRVKFVQGSPSAEFQSELDTILAAWKAAKLSLPIQAVSFYGDSDLSVEPALLTQRASAIVVALGGPANQGTVPVPLKPPAMIPSDECRAWTFVRSKAGASAPIGVDVGPATVEHAVYAVRAQNQGWTGTLLPLLKAGRPADAALADLTTKGVAARLGVASFAKGDNKLRDPAALSKLPTWAPGARIKQPAMYWFAKASPPDTAAFLKGQVLAIETAVGAPTAVGPQPAASPVAPPGGHAVLTLILVETD